MFSFSINVDRVVLFSVSTFKEWLIHSLSSRLDYLNIRNKQHNIILFVNKKFIYYCPYYNNDDVAILYCLFFTSFQFYFELKAMKSEILGSMSIVRMSFAVF